MADDKTATVHVGTAPTLEDLLGPEILTTNGIVPTSDALAGKKRIGMYFAANWCPPCRTFTPIVSRIYKDLIEADSDIEILFVSCDGTQEQFDEYWGSSMAFPALPYEPRSMKTKLGKQFDVKFIPTLFFLDATTSKIIMRSGVEIIEDGINEDEYFQSVREALGLAAAPP
ncbi:hypothetical protein DYB32_001202 [Aphanomyces invadans]|uniref:Thioredoxin domain-containing protein n=1 Tax=Aphanomyces invadans TaxID=157072 RepID=A0A418B765_9STRA|nr:hypothetical protein DYB32_001202 [Aphanomyces invadans]